MARRAFLLRVRDKTVELGKTTRIMGVVNLTPDSFSDGGRFCETEKAVERCLALARQGADFLDLGAESSRPGALPISDQEEMERLMPVLEAVRKELSIPLSVDTCKAQVAGEALREGADIVNDISAFQHDPAMPQVLAQWKAGVVLMHMRGTPQNMQELPPSPDIVKEITADLAAAVATASDHGVPRESILVDPGIGFGKTVQDNCAILNRLSFLDTFGLPILIGTSRKGFLGDIVGRPVDQRIWATASSVAVSVLQGAHVVRVHEVEEMKQVAALADAVLAEGLDS